MKILVISSIPTHPQDLGAKTRVYNLLSNLEKLDNQVHFLYNNIEWVGSGLRVKHINQKVDLKKMEKRWDRFYYVSDFSISRAIIYYLDRSIGQIGIFLKIIFPFVYKKIKPLFRKNIVDVSIDRWYRPRLDKFIKKLVKKEKFDMVIVEYVFLSKAFDHFDDKVIKVIDTLDVFTDRHILFEKSNMRHDWFFTTAQEEAKGLNRSDVIIAIQEQENDFFSKITNRKVINVGHLVSISKPEVEIKDQKGILFVGSNHSANIQGINFFINEVFPIIRANFSEVNLIIAGKISNDIENFDNGIRLGEVDDLELIYSSARVVINPVRTGTGLKIKSIEALGFSKPLVTTSHSAIGLEEGAGKAFFVADKAKDFANSIIRILSSESLTKELSKNAFVFAKKYNDNNLRELRELVTVRK